MKMILAVDDNPQDLSLLRTLLERHGYAVTTAADGAEALEKARRQRPDLILSDILMPVMDGFALCREWMRDDGLKDVPFMFLTASYTDSRDEEFALRLGAERYIVKPQDQQVLLGMIGEVLSGRKAGRRVAPIGPPPDESVVLREYNSVLVRKLEDKMVEIEGANLRLELEAAERKRSERVLKDSEERFRVVFEDARDGIILVDEESRKIDAANRTFCDMVQYTLDEVRRLGISDIHPEESLPLLSDAFEKMMKQGSWLAENFPVRRKDGSIFYADIKSNPVTISGKKFVVGNFRDVTQLQSLEKQLRAAQKMEAVGTLAGGIAHDFNNVLTVILGFGELLKLRIANDPKAVSDVDEILRAAERASVLTRQLLSFARRQVIDPVNLDLNLVVTDLDKLLRKVLREDIRIRTTLAEKVPTIRADQGHVEQVLINLSLNARDAMPGGGQLLVETREEWIDEEYVKQYPYMKAGRYAVLSVSDTGIGMDEGTRDRIFEPFFTTKEPDKGTGLGLAVVYGVVKQHNGFIHVYSEPGKGTTFRIYFPAVDVSPDSKVVVAREVFRGGSETILLAEDNESVRHLAEQTLITYGYRLLTACDGEEAVDIFRRHGKEIAIVVLDMVMPKMGGKQAYDAMIATNPGLKAIFMSGYSADAIHDSFVLHPGVTFLQKPFAPGSLARAVREVLDSA